MMTDDEIFAALADIDVDEALTDTTGIVSDCLAAVDPEDALEEIDAESILKALE